MRNVADKLPTHFYTSNRHLSSAHYHYCNSSSGPCVRLSWLVSLSKPRPLPTPLISSKSHVPKVINHTVWTPCLPPLPWQKHDFQLNLLTARLKANFMHLTLDKWVMDSPLFLSSSLPCTSDIAKLKDNDQMWCIVYFWIWLSSLSPSCPFPLFSSFSPHAYPFLIRNRLRALVIGLMLLFGVHNMKHAIWLSNYSFLKWKFEDRGTGCKIIAVSDWKNSSIFLNYKKNIFPEHNKFYCRLRKMTKIL